MSGNITSDGSNEATTPDSFQGVSTGSAATSHKAAETAADSHKGTIQADSSYFITDQNPTQAGGELAVDASGALSLKINGGDFQ